MGIIGSIRKHSIWAVVIVGIAIVAFILGDLTKNRNSIPDMGRVNNETMTSQRFNELVAEQKENIKMQQRTEQLPSEMETQIRQQVWQRFVTESLMKEQTEKLGLRVTPAEKNDMYTGTFIHPYVRQNFTDPKTGQFDIRQINYWIENFDQLDTIQRMQWVELEKYVAEDREQQKYSTLISSGFYMPKTIAKKIAEYSNTTSNVRVVALPFSNVKDEEVSLTDDDYKKYFEEHKSEYKVRDDFREIEFITYPIVPTQQDLANIQAEIEKIWNDFQAVPEDEILFFVNAESDHSYDSSYVKASTFSAPLDEQIAAAKPGQMIAPAIIGNQWIMAKVMSSAMRPDSLMVNITYIFNSKAGGNITRSEEQAKQLVDSLMAEIHSGKATFEQVKAKNNDLPQEEDSGKWKLDGQFGYINDEIINHPVGSSFSIEIPNKVGYLLVNVMDKTKASQKYRVATITRALEPSAATNRAVYNEANKFAGQNRTIAELKLAAQQGNLQVRSDRIGIMSDRIGGISNAREIVQWAYNKETKAGNVANQVYECDNMFIVVALKDIYKKGYLTFAQAKPMLEQAVRLEKKADLLMARAENAVKAGKDINSIATKLNVAVDSVDSVAFNDYYFSRYGMEPKVQATIAVTKSGLTKPIKGASGVYMVQVDSKAKRDINADQIKMQLEQPYRQKLNMAMQVLIDNAKIIDQRNKFF